MAVYNPPHEWKGMALSEVRDELGETQNQYPARRLTPHTHSSLSPQQISHLLHNSLTGRAQEVRIGGFVFST